MGEELPRFDLRLTTRFAVLAEGLGVLVCARYVADTFPPAIRRQVLHHSVMFELGFA